MIDRRGFLLGIIAAASAPVIVRADSLMKIKPLRDPIIDLIIKKHDEFVSRQLLVEIFGTDSFGRTTAETIAAHGPDVMLVGKSLFKTIQKVVVEPLAYPRTSPLHQPSQQAYPYRELTAGLSLRNRRT